MPDTINVRGLPEEDIQLVQRLVERLRARAKRNTGPGNESEPEGVEVRFGTWALGVKGKLTRKEIYDYL
jgi:hypothetical protein